MIWWVVATAQAHVPVVWFMGPDDDWCTFFNEQAWPGDQIHLLPGTYEGSCEIRARDTDDPGEFSVIRAADLGDPPKLLHDGQSPHILSVDGQELWVQGLQFGPVPAGVTALEVRRATEMQLQYNTFSGGSGDQVVVRGEADGLLIDSNDFLPGQGAALTLGCERAGVPAPTEHDDTGSPDTGRTEIPWTLPEWTVPETCQQGVQVIDNLIDGGSIGIRAKRGVVGQIWHNILRGADLGIEMRGNGQLSWAANYVDGGETGLQIIDGPVLVRSSIFTGQQVAVKLEDGTSGARVLGNTLIADRAVEGAIDLNEVVGNAASQPIEGRNVYCPDEEECWIDIANRDLSPAPTGALIGAGGETSDSSLAVDFCGRLRETPPNAGALDQQTEPLQFIRKKDYPCMLPSLGLDGRADTEEGGVVSPVACGCIQGGHGAYLGLWAVWLLARRRYSLN